jgi:hypothetical protein
MELADKKTKVKKGTENFLLRWFRDSHEQEELEEFVRTQQNMIFQGTFLEAMKLFIWLIILLTFLVLIIYTAFVGYESKYSKLINDVFVFFIGALIFQIVLQYCPLKMNYFIPWFIWFSMIKTADLWLTSNGLVISEYVITTAGLINIMVMIIPTQWVSNTIGYVVSIIYFITMWYYKYGYITTELKIASIITVIFSSLEITFCTQS